MRISILNAGEQTDYLYGIVSGLSEIPELKIEVVDSDRAVGVIDQFSSARLFNLRGDNISPQIFPVKVFRIIRYYVQLMYYAVCTSSELFHIQWEKNGFAFFDRTFLIAYYKLLGKKIIFTSHNIYKEARDGRATWYHWLSLKIMYILVDRIIVHTSQMKLELLSLFRIAEDKIIVIPHGINNRVCRSRLSFSDARQKLDIDATAHVILFFGQIDTYKGVETLIEAVSSLVKSDPSILLIIAGQAKRKSSYVADLKKQAGRMLPDKNIKFDLRYIPIEEVESYFISADCLVLPYKRILQSGVIFLAYRFGLPIIATDVGSFSEDIIDGKTGYICAPDNPKDLAEKISNFFSSYLFIKRDQTRNHIIEFAEKKYSWKDISKKTFNLYSEVLKKE